MTVETRRASTSADPWVNSALEIARLAEYIAHTDFVPHHFRGNAAAVQALARFMDAWDIEPLGVETLLASTTHGYAGTADLWATVGALDGQRALLDLKTGGGIYREYALQLAGYRWADFLQAEDGTEQPVPEVDACYCIHLDRKGPDGPQVRLVPVTVTRDTFATFLSLLDTLRWLKTEPVGEPLTILGPVPEGVAV